MEKLFRVVLLALLLRGSPGQSHNIFPSSEHGSGGSLAPSVARQLLTLVQQLDTKLAIMNQSIKGLGDRLKQTENKITNLQAEMETQSNFQSEIQQLLVNFSKCDNEKLHLDSTTDYTSNTTCSRGMAAYLPQDFPQYTVIKPPEDSVLDFPYLCDTATDGGGWIVIQRRNTGEVDFYRGWASYAMGFGYLSREFWMGNEYIHRLTSSGTYELRVELKHGKKSVFAHYGTFSVESEKNNFILHVGPYDGTAADSLTYHDGRSFSTHDKDNDARRQGNCAKNNLGAWWYGSCYESNLNGRWGFQGPIWNGLANDNALSFSEMKIRRVD